MNTGRTAVALHGVEPATLDRCRDLRAWLAERGVDRVTLFVLPAPSSRPFPGRVPGILGWLDARTVAGDSVAQLGYLGTCDEWARLGEGEASERLESGRRLLSLGGFEPRGFAPVDHGWTPALRSAAAKSFDWTADRMRIRGARDWTARAIRPASSNGVGRLAGRPGAMATRDLLRLDLSPADARLSELERLISPDREYVTYDELAAGVRERVASPVAATASARVRGAC